MHRENKVIISNHDHVLNAWNTSPFANHRVKSAETTETELSAEIHTPVHQVTDHRQTFTQLFTCPSRRARSLLGGASTDTYREFYYF